MNLIEELRWRGLVQDIIPGTEEQLNKEMTTGYVGFDPTAESLHIGSLVPILLLVHLQRAGHKPIALIGGATGMIGDPSGKSAERNLLDENTLLQNAAGIKKQLEKFINFNATIANNAIMVNNYDWFRQIGFLEFIREAGKHISVNYMMAKESVKQRIEGDAGISFTEFTYQLIQGYDFYWLYKNFQCKLQMGGSDQWGNITTGNELIKKKLAGEAFAFTCPLIKKADGGKFGKTEKGNIWLDPEKTSPYQFYQFWLNTSDEDAAKWIKIFTFLSEQQIQQIAQEHVANPAKRILQKNLAAAVTAYVHGHEALLKAQETTETLFSEQKHNIEFTEESLQNMEGVVQINFDKETVSKGINVVEFLAKSNILPSKGEARKMVQNGGITINREKVLTISQMLFSESLLFNRYFLVQKGKKNYFLVEVL